VPIARDDAFSCQKTKCDTEREMLINVASTPHSILGGMIVQQYITQRRVGVKPTGSGTCLNSIKKNKRDLTSYRNRNYRNRHETNQKG